MLRAPSNLSVRFGWVVLVVATLAVITVSLGEYQLLAAHLKLHCVNWIGGPTPVVVCDDGHAYQRQGHTLVDMGSMSGDPGNIPMR